MIRDATAADAAACALIYAPYVTGTAITFETEPPHAAAVVDRIAAAQVRHAWLVIEQEGEVAGFAFAGRIRSRPAYDRSCETSVYLRQGLQRAGLGRELTTALLQRLTDRGFARAFAAVALPNEASVGLHRSLGFREAGVWERVGFKFGRWWDVAWFQRDLG